MGILSTNKKIINLGQGYSAGNGISIDDYVISYTGNEGQLYSAGPNIDIYTDQDQLYISGKDWSADIANASSNAFEQATALIPPEFDPSYISGVVDSKLDSTAFSTVSGDYATTSYVDMSDDLTYSRATAWANQNLAPLNSVADNSAKWNGSTNVVETNSAAWFDNVGDAEVNNFVYTNSATINEVNSTVQTNSAQWSENTGDVEVNNAVYNNSANWNDITVYQTNSASYLTEHQDLSNYATTGDLEQVSGDIVSLIPSTAGLATETDLQIVSGGVDYISSVAITSIPTGTMNESNFEYDGNELITAYNGSAFAGQGGGSIDTIPVAVISPLVTGFSGESAYLGIESTALDLSAYVPVSSLTFNSNYLTGVSGKQISSYYAYSAYTARNAYTANTASRAFGDRNGNEITSYYQPKLTIAGDDGTITAINNSAIGGTMTAAFELSAGDGISITDDLDASATVISVTAQGGNPEVEQVVQTYSAGGTWLTAGDIAGLATTAQVDTASSFLSGSIDYVSGALTGYQPIGSYATTGELDTASSFLSGAIDYVSGQNFSGLYQAQYGVTTYNDIKNAVDNHKIVYCSSGGRMAFLAFSGADNYEFQYYRSIATHSNSQQGDQVFVYKITNPKNWSVTTREAYSIISAGNGLSSTYASNKLTLGVNGSLLNNYLTTAQYETDSANWEDATTAYQTNSATYMSEPNLEYNAVNEISAYNGSAIAQYGAEKQWLQHDDTLVHAANSAQYALGVNLSAVAQLLGVDETLLFSGNIGTIGGNITINEPIQNFNKIGVSLNNNSTISYYQTETIPTEKMAFRVQWAYNYIQDAFIKLVPVNESDVNFKYDGNTLVLYKHNATGVTTIIDDTTYLTSASKLRIYGIGRKA